MKQVSDPCLVDDARSYGILIDGDKGFISRASFHSGEYRALCASSVTRGNSWPAYGSANLADAIRGILNPPFRKVYEFRSDKKLFAWLAK